MKPIAIPELVLITLVIAFVAAVVVWPFWRIFKRIGLPGPLALLMIVPGVSLVIIFVVAFTKWPIEDRVRHVKVSGNGSV